MIMSTNRSKTVGRFVGPATKSSKTASVPMAKMLMNIRKAASFLSELNMLAKDILHSIIGKRVSIVFFESKAAKYS